VVFALLGVAPAVAQAALGDISSVAGGYPPGPNAATSVGQRPASVATVTLGGHSYTYVADPTHDVVTRIDDGTGQQQVIAGTGTPGFSGDGGLATSAQLDNPQSVAVDPGGNVAIADGGDRIRFVAAFSATEFGQSMTVGDIYTIVGNGTAGYTGDTGPATSAEMNNGPGFFGIPGGGLAFDGAGNLAIADSLNNVVRMVENAGVHTHFNQSMTAGDIYTIAGTGTACSPSTAACGDGGAASSAKLNEPLGVAFDATEDLAVADTEDQRVRFVVQGASTFGGTPVTVNDIYTVAGTGSTGSGCTGVNLPATSLALSLPIGISFTPSGGIVVGDTNDACVRFVSNTSTGYICTPIAAGDMCTIAGDGTFGFVGDGGTANAAELRGPQGASVGTDGLAIADTQNSRVRFVPTASGSLFGGFKTAGDIYTVAGNGSTGFSGDGLPATGTELSTPTGVAVAPQGGFAIGDFGNSRIRFVPSASGTAFGQAVTGGDMYTVAGNGSFGPSGDGGPATSAQLSQAEGARFDANGDLVIADRFNHKVRFVPAASGTYFGQAMTANDIYTIAGDGTGAFGGDGGPGPAAELQEPSGVFADSSGNVVIADTKNFRVRYVPASSGTFFGQAMTAGDIYTIAGSATQGFAGDGGAATSAEFQDPQDVVENGSGDLFIADGSNNRVRFIPASSGTFFGQAMTANDIYTIAGNGTAGSTGDGDAPTAAELNFPEGLAADAIGDVAIAEGSGQRVRFIPARNGVYFGPSMTAGDIYTIAGNGTQGSAGDGGVATSAEFDFPDGVAFDPTGDVLIADSGNNRIRMVSGTIPTPGGGGPGGAGPGGGGPGTPTVPGTPTGLLIAKAKVTKVVVHGTKVLVSLSCTGNAKAKCPVNLKLSVTETLRRGKVIAVSAAKRKAKTKKRVVVVGSAAVTLHGGKRKTVTISLNRAGRRLLAHRRKLKVTLTVSEGRTRIYRHKETLTKPKPKPKRHRHRPAADLTWRSPELRPG
jgi:hypothetical protein